MIADRAINSYSNGMLNELELDGYCDFGFLPATALLPRVTSSKLDLRSSKLDEVVRAFAKVYDGSDIDSSKLIKACRAHLDLMRNGGSALCLVAKDLESNLRKVEDFFCKRPKECKTLSSLLELERGMGAHDGNCLHDPSAAMGLLWIRRSLAFQSHLFDALIPRDGRHPKDAACEAYGEHLAPYHGWMLRSVFPVSLSQMPVREVFVAKFGEVDVIQDLDEEDERKVIRKLRALILTLEPLLLAWKETFERLDLEDTRRV